VTTGRRGELLIVSLAAERFGLNPYWLVTKAAPREFDFICACTMRLIIHDREVARALQADTEG
jgi:hypothetical protein